MGLGWRSEVSPKECRNVINAAKRWLRHAAKVGPDDVQLIQKLEEELDEAHGLRDLEMIAATMRVRDALIWHLRKDRADNTAANARLLRKIEAYCSRDWDRLGRLLNNAAETAVQRLRESRPANVRWRQITIGARCW
jgi:hypothetical protein